MRNTDKKKENMVLMSMRISAEDKEEIEAKARKTGLSTSEYIRRCALGRKLPCYGDTSLLKEYSMQLGKIGSNLNQIAKHLNGGGDFYSIYYELKEAIRELLDLKFKILPALEDVACGNGGNVQLFAQDFRLCSLTGARGAQQNQLHLSSDGAGPSACRSRQRPAGGTWRES